MREQKILLNADQKIVVERDIKAAYNALATLSEWAKNDGLNEEMKETLPTVVDGYMNSVKEAIGYTGEKSEREKEMTESIAVYYQKQIKELKAALDDNNSISSIPGNLELAFEKVKKWWNVEGFRYIRKKSLTHNGYMELELGFMLESFFDSMSMTPSKDKQKHQTKIEYIKSKGFQFAPSTGHRDLELLDNDFNRNALSELITEAFPSAKVHSIKNRLQAAGRYEKSDFVITGLEVIIYDLSDIENLVVEEKIFADDDDE